MANEGTLKIINKTLSKTSNDCYITDFSAEKNAYYTFEIGYAHDYWDASLKVDITYPDGRISTFLKGLPHGKNMIKLNVFLECGTNRIAISHYFGEILLNSIKATGPAEITDYRISPENIFFSCDAPKNVKMVLQNYRKELVEIKTESGTPIPFEVRVKEPYNEYTASIVEVFLDKEVVFWLGEGEHTLCYCLENGVTLEQSLTVKKATPKTDLQFINFNVGCANATLIMLPNGKKYACRFGNRKECT